MARTGFAGGTGGLMCTSHCPVPVGLRPAVRSVLLGGMLLTAGVAESAGFREASDPPRNIIHADLLAGAFGKRMWGLYYERTREAEGNQSFAWGVGWAERLEATAQGGAAVSEVEADLGAIGLQFRYYRHAPRGFFTVVGLTLLFGEAKGEDDEERQRKYTVAAYDVSLLGLGYQLLVADRLSIEGTTSLHTALGGLFEKGGDDRGTVGGFGIGVAGGVGFAF